MNEALIEYMNNYRHLDSPKPENEKVFIDLFIDYVGLVTDLDDLDNFCVGSYFGNQFQITPYQGPFTYHRINIEIAYNRNQIVVYDGHHNGFWTAPYISMTAAHPDFKLVHDAVMNMLKRVFML